MSVDPSLHKYTYEHYALFPSDGKRHEVVDGDHFVNPAPNLRHQAVSRNILVALCQQIQSPGLGAVFCAPIDVQLSEYDIVQPDLVVVLHDRKEILTKTKIDGVPSLVVEILSPSTADYDRKVKQQAYLRAGVPEYWIVDPDQESIDQFVLRDGQFEQLEAGNTPRINVQANRAISVDASSFWV